MRAVDSVRVRMYRQGLGDCFLLTVTTGGIARHMLLDFGLLLGSPDAATRMTAVADDIRAVTGGHLDVLAATHEHWDHISGFVQGQDVLSTLTVGEVWLAWTEDPHDQTAQSMRAERARGIRALAGAAHALQDGSGGRAEQLLSVLGFYGDVGLTGRATTTEAMQWIQQRPATVRYLSPGQLLPALGIRVYVLGPPRDRAMIHRSDPSVAVGEVYTMADAGQDAGFLTAAQALAAGQDPEAPVLPGPPGLQPFEAFFRLEPGAAAAVPLIAEDYGDPDQDWRRIDQDWLGAADVLALNLDSNTNNTSLVLAFEVGDGQVLLFPGDAQVGNWLSWQSVTWTTDAGTVTGPELLARTRLYKVGHHGSHNATLREKGLELMTSPDLVAMLPVNRVAAAKQRWNMPLPGLLKRLEEKTKGRILDAELGVPTSRPDALTPAQWQDFLAHTDVQEFWVDHTVTWTPSGH